MWLKVFPSNYKMKDMQYMSGQLNLLNKEFKEKGSYHKFGLYYAEPKHIHNFYEYGNQDGKK
jgi:hypothetical protein